MLLVPPVLAIGRAGMPAEAVERERDAFVEGGALESLRVLAESYRATALRVAMRLSPGKEPLISAFVDMPSEKFIAFQQEVVARNLGCIAHLGASDRDMLRMGIPLSNVANRQQGMTL